VRQQIKQLEQAAVAIRTATRVRLTRSGQNPPIPSATTTGGRMNFDIKTEQLERRTYVISLAGEVDLYTAPEFKQQLLEVIGKGGKTSSSTSRTRRSSTRRRSACSSAA
jgi:hypothetical protein